MKKITVFLIALLTVGAMQAQIIHVPGDYPTIRQGIEAASNGDTVLVSDGIYYEQINFLGKKPLMVASRFLTDGDTSHIANTIIDGSLAPDPDSASVVYFTSGEDTTSVLCGFTIRNGKGTYTPDNELDRQGGGIWISGAGAKIIHNRITHNVLDDTPIVSGNSTSGAGIGSKWEENALHWIVIGNNTIDSNTCISKYEYAYGGGIATSYNSRIYNNVISRNTCSGLQASTGQGGGIGVARDNAWSTPIVTILDHNIIIHNKTQAQNNFANSAGLFFQNVQCLFSDNEVKYNNAVTGNTVGGCGGMLLYQSLPGSVVRGNIFEGNVSNMYAGGLGIQNDVVMDNPVLVENNYFFDNTALNGGSFSTHSGPVNFQNNVFRGNQAEKGGALYIKKLFSPLVHMVTLVNNTFSANEATESGGALYSLSNDPLIFNSVFWQNTSPNGEELYVSGGTAEIAYSDLDTVLINGNRIIGAGMISADPLFEDNNLLSTENWSPCVDQGAGQYTCAHGQTFNAPGTDLVGNPRPAGSGYDMGAYDIIGWGQGTGRMTNDELGITNYPNPVTSHTTFSFTLKNPGQVTFQIFNCYGQLVSEIRNTVTAAGRQSVEWNSGILTSGIYFYSVQAGNLAGNGTFIIYK